MGIHNKINRNLKLYVFFLIYIILTGIMVGPAISQRLPVYDWAYISWPQIIGSLGGVASHIAYNLSKRRPLYSSVPRLVGLVAIGFTVGSVTGEFRDWKRNRDQLMVEDYIRLHPEDFPLVEPKKY